MDFDEKKQSGFWKKNSRGSKLQPYSIEPKQFSVPKNIGKFVGTTKNYNLQRYDEKIRVDFTKITLKYYKELQLSMTQRSF